jgi:hypothetical protein
LARLDRTLASLARDGLSVVRVFLLCDARSGVRFDGDGFPMGLDAAVLPDLDEMLSAARRHRVGLMPVLLDFHLCDAPQIVNGVQLGGRSGLVTDPDAGSAFIDRVLRPIVERFATDEWVLAWDVMNEPEWCRVPFEPLQRFLAEAVQCVRGWARQPVTIGSAGTWRLDLVTPLGLDFYQIHWYDRFGWGALARPVADLGLSDRPVILGEFAGRGAPAADVLDAARQAGYAGALVWSVLADDEQSAYPASLAEWIRAQS